MQESPLYTRTYDLLLWLIPQAQNFPRRHRFGLAERIQRLALDFQDVLVAAGKSNGIARLDCLKSADVKLEQLRVWVRLASDLQCLTIRQHEHAARLMGEVGKLLGAWLKKLSK
jgi:hypothetical protein